MLPASLQDVEPLAPEVCNRERSTYTQLQVTHPIAVATMTRGSPQAIVKVAPRPFVTPDDHEPKTDARLNLISHDSLMPSDYGDGAGVKAEG